MGFDPVSYLMGKQAGGGGGGVTVEPLSVTANGTYTAPSGKAYSPVTVAVPGPAWTEFISATATTNIVESLGVLFQDSQTGKLYSVAIAKNVSDYINNQLVGVITYNNGGDVTSWPTAYMRWRTASATYSATIFVSTSYDAAIQVGDKFFICEV